MLLAAAMVFLLGTAAVVLVPASALPPRVAERVDGRRELLLFIGLCALGAGALLTFVVVFASS